MLVYKLWGEINTDVHANVGKVALIALDVVGETRSLNHVRLLPRRARLVLLKRTLDRHADNQIHDGAPWLLSRHVLPRHCVMVIAAAATVSSSSLDATGSL